MLIDWAKWARNKSDPLSHIPDEDTMICTPCRDERHYACPDYEEDVQRMHTKCFCQHKMKTTTGELVDEARD